MKIFILTKIRQHLNKYFTSNDVDNFIEKYVNTNDIILDIYYEVIFDKKTMPIGINALSPVNRITIIYPNSNYITYRVDSPSGVSRMLFGSQLIQIPIQEIREEQLKSIGIC